MPKMSLGRGHRKGREVGIYHHTLVSSVTRELQKKPQIAMPSNMRIAIAGKEYSLDQKPSADDVNERQVPVA